MVFEKLLDPIMRPLLSLSPFWAIFIMATIITAGITLVYKYATDQKRMKHLKGELKKFQKKMKDAQKAKNTEKMMRLQKESMGLNMELMKHSFKPTLYTFIPIIIIFGWLNASMAFHNLSPNQQFNLTATFVDGVQGNASLTVIPDVGFTIDEPVKTIVDSRAVWTLEADAGTYKTTVIVGDANSSSSQKEEKTVLVTDEWRYETPLSKFKKSSIKSIELSNKPVKPLGDISLLGWHPGWLGTYIILSLILSILFRKALKVV